MDTSNPDSSHSAQTERVGVQLLSDLEFALQKQRAEAGDALRCDVITLRLVLGHLVLQGDETDGGALLLLQAEELQDALVVVHVAVDEDEQNLDSRERRQEGESSATWT